MGFRHNKNDARRRVESYRSIINRSTIKRSIIKRSIIKRSTINRSIINRSTTCSRGTVLVLPVHSPDINRAYQYMNLIDPDLPVHNPDKNCVYQYMNLIDSDFPVHNPDNDKSNSQLLFMNRRSSKPCVTVSVENMEFLHPSTPLK